MTNILYCLGGVCCGATFVWLYLTDRFKNQVKAADDAITEAVIAKERYEAGFRSLPIDGKCHRRGP